MHQVHDTRSSERLFWNHECTSDAYKKIDTQIAWTFIHGSIVKLVPRVIRCIGNEHTTKELFQRTLQTDHAPVASFPYRPSEPHDGTEAFTYSY